MSEPWTGRSHGDLAELVRELLLLGHLIDRSGMPHAIARFGREGMAEIAIDEWMAASPIYTRRIQELLGFRGDTVEVIFKGMQLDIGAPPEFLDFRYTVHDDHHGEFHLDHCGALMDVEPMGEDYVRTMCHDIEDPTFDATATATNPRARMTPIHRPPRRPSDRSPHCAWTVEIVPDADPLPIPPQSIRLADSEAARLPIAERPTDLPDDDGDRHYDGPVDSDLMTERFSSATLAALADEICLQQHLLARGFLLPIADRIGAEATELGVAQLTGIAGVAARRLASVLSVGSDLASVAAVLAVHPMLLPRSYTAAEVRLDDDEVEIRLGDGPAGREDDGLTWPSLLQIDQAPIEAAVRAILPTAQVRRSTTDAGELRWTVTDDPDAEPTPQADAVTLVEFSSGVAFEFGRRGSATA